MKLFLLPTERNNKISTEVLVVSANASVVLADVLVVCRLTCQPTCQWCVSRCVGSIGRRVGSMSTNPSADVWADVLVRSDSSCLPYHFLFN